MEAIKEALGFGYYVLVYGIGILAMTLSVIAFQFKRRVTIILCTCFAQISWVLYFLLQSDVTSAVACGLSAIMLAIFSKKEKWKWAAGKVSCAVFIVLISGFSMLSFKVWSDVFSILAGIFAVIANSQSKENRLRKFSLVWCVSWLLNSTFKMYPVAFINDLFCTISTIVALVRYRERKSLSE